MDFRALTRRFRVVQVSDDLVEGERVPDGDGAEEESLGERARCGGSMGSGGKTEAGIDGVSPAARIHGMF